MNEPIKRNWVAIVGANLGFLLVICSMVVAWPPYQNNLRLMIDIFVLGIGLPFFTMVFYLRQAFVRITEEGVGYPLSRSILWAEIVAVRIEGKRIELRSESRGVVIALWPFRSPPDVVSYITERVRPSVHCSNSGNVGPTRTTFVVLRAAALIGMPCVLGLLIWLRTSRPLAGALSSGLLLAIVLFGIWIDPKRRRVRPGKADSGGRES
jgi:hypothetical protein